LAGRYALIVANGTYRDEKLSRLRTPTRDAEALARVLNDPQIGDFSVELAIDEPEAVLRRKIATFFADRGRDDLLLLHFSCHGLKDDSGQLYFAAPDTEVAHLDATALSAEFVSRQMTRSRSRKVVALLDCCYSGAIARGLRFRGGDQVDLDDHLGGHGRVILTASSAMEYAFEGEELTGDGNPSVFTTAVVRVSKPVRRTATRTTASRSTSSTTTSASRFERSHRTRARTCSATSRASCSSPAAPTSRRSRPRSSPTSSAARSTARSPACARAR
jgi:hypothetical protein